MCYALGAPVTEPMKHKRATTASLCAAVANTEPPRYSQSYASAREANFLHGDFDADGGGGGGKGDGDGGNGSGALNAYG